MGSVLVGYHEIKGIESEWGYVVSLQFRVYEGVLVGRERSDGSTVETRGGHSQTSLSRRRTRLGLIRILA